MGFETAVLASRTGLAAVDSAPVAAAAQRILGGSLYVEFELSAVTGAPSSIDARAALEGSADGTNWHQLVRFVDLAAAGKRIARLGGANAAATEAAFAGSALGTANASTGVLVDGALPLFVRAVTMLKTLTGGTAPTAAITVRLSVS